jgi:hypothetical protein
MKHGKIKAEQWEVDAIEGVLESILGYSGGVWGGKDVISVCDPTGHCTSMCIDTFLENFRREFEIK